VRVRSHTRCHAHPTPLPTASSSSLHTSHPHPTGAKAADAERLHVEAKNLRGIASQVWEAAKTCLTGPLPELTAALPAIVPTPTPSISTRFSFCKSRALFRCKPRPLPGAQADADGSERRQPHHRLRRPQSHIRGSRCQRRRGCCFRTECCAGAAAADTGGGGSRLQRGPRAAAVGRHLRVQNNIAGDGYSVFKAGAEEHADAPGERGRGCG